VEEQQADAKSRGFVFAKFEKKHSVKVEEHPHSIGAVEPTLD
jgi:hypothetical protein